MELEGGEFIVLQSAVSAVHYHSSPPTHPSLDFEGHKAHPKIVMRGFSELGNVDAGQC